MADTKSEDGDDLPTSTIIIVGVVCGIVVVALTIVLIILCCRRRHAQKKYEEDQLKTTAPPSQTRPVLRGIENPGVEGDTIDFDDPTAGGVFATPSSQNQYDPYAQRQPNNRSHSNGYGPTHGAGYHSNEPTHGAGYHSNEPPPSYDDYSKTSYSNNAVQYAVVNKKKDKIYLDNHLHELSKEGSSDSGVSTPDPSTKPKKVIHEVIV